MAKYRHERENEIIKLTKCNLVALVSKNRRYTDTHRLWLYSYGYRWSWMSGSPGQECGQRITWKLRLGFFFFTYVFYGIDLRPFCFSFLSIHFVLYTPPIPPISPTLVPFFFLLLFFLFFFLSSFSLLFLKLLKVEI